MSRAYLDSLPEGSHRRLYWLATHAPKPRRLSDIPHDPKFVKSWNDLPFWKDDRKIFPLYKWYRFASRKFGLKTEPNFRPGVPGDILKDFYEHGPPRSFHRVYDQFYFNSFYSENMHMRICEISYGMVKKKTNLSFRSIARAYDFLRHYRYIRQIWRGRPYPEDPRYLHSCYELPVNLNHVICWRIHNVKTIKKDKNFKET